MRRWMIRRTDSADSRRLGDRGDVGRRRRLADQQALHLDRQHDRDDDEQEADGERPDGVPAGVAGGVGEDHAREREEQADQRAGVLEQHDRQLGLLGTPDPVQPAAAGRAVRVGLLVGGAQREALQQHREQQDPDGDREVLDIVGVAELLDPLVDREQAAHREQHEGDDERPEVPLAAVAERVRRVGRLGRPLAAEQQERLVAGVGQRVAGLGEQAGRTRDQEAGELGDGDPEVGERRRRGSLDGCPRAWSRDWQMSHRSGLTAQSVRHSLRPAPGAYGTSVARSSAVSGTSVARPLGLSSECFVRVAPAGNTRMPSDAVGCRGRRHRDAARRPTRSVTWR